MWVLGVLEEQPVILIAELFLQSPLSPFGVCVSSFETKFLYIALVILELTL